MEEYHRNPAVSNGFRLPDGRHTPWLSSQPMAGFYNTEPGECHHWLACERDARQPIFARLADRDHAYTLYNCRDARLSHSQYTSLYALSDKKHLRGPPGSNTKRSNFEPSESRITDVRKWVFPDQNKLSKPFTRWLRNRRFKPWWRVGRGKEFSQKKII